VKSSAWLACAFVALAASSAHAHLGAVVAVAKFTNPLDPMVVQGNPNDSVPGFAWTSADQSIVITWSDGDADPTGRFTFYYIDHQPNFEITADDIEAGLATKIDDPVNLAGGYFASCYCEGDQGVTCPMVTRDPAGNCANQITWTTSTIAPGTYWIVAVNNDPPFHTAYTSNAPVRVAHGGTPLPAALVVRPDGYGAWDKSYHLQWLADGRAPLSFDLAYGLEDTGVAQEVPTAIAAGLLPAPNGDGTFSYDWDVSQLMSNKSYWVRLKVTDGDGNSTFTDSHFAVTVSHATTTPTPDMAMAAKKKSGCEVGANEPPSRGLVSTLAVLGALLAALYVARRAARRG
jgi:hypothetical protein